MDLTAVEKKLERVIKPGSFRFIVIFYSHTSQIKKIRDFITSKYDDCKSVTLDLRDATYQSLSPAIYEAQDGFVFIEDFEEIFANEDLYHGFNQRRDKIAKHNINLITFAHIEGQEEIIKNLYALTPDLWEFKSAVFEITEKEEFVRAEALENWNFGSSLGGIREREKQKESIRLKHALKNTKDSELQINLYTQLMIIHRDIGRLNETQTYMEELQELLSKNDYKNLEHLASIYNEFSQTYREMGDLKQALTYQLKSIEIQEAIYENRQHPDLATAYGNLASIYQDMGDLKQALTYQLKDIAIEEEIYENKQHPNLAIAYGNLALIYQDMRDLKQALTYQLKRIEIQEEIFENKLHPSIAAAYGNLASIYQDMGDLKQALTYQLKSIEIIEAIYENRQHPNLMITYWTLATIYENLNQKTESQRFMKQAYAIYRFNFPDGHPLYEHIEDSKERILGKEEEA